jgi:putative spermidine/putrescine transport system permease protein
MRTSRRARIAWWVFGAVVLTFVYVPLAVIAINSFNKDKTFGWPPTGFTTQWWSLAFDAPGPREAFLTSVKAGIGATALALVLGALLSLALARYDFFGKTAVNLLVILPIALPGIVTGLALQSVITGFLTPVLGIPAGLFTIIVGHATFCIVVVFNNATARLRRMGTSLEAASADLGAGA